MLRHVLHEDLVIQVTGVVAMHGLVGVLGAVGLAHFDAGGGLGSGRVEEKKKEKRGLTMEEQLWVCTFFLFAGLKTVLALLAARKTA